MKADTLDEKISDKEENSNELKNDKLNKNVISKKKKMKNEKLFLNKKREIKNSVKYPLRKMINFTIGKRNEISKLFNLMSKEILNLSKIFEKKMFITDLKSEMNVIINSLIDFNKDSLKETINSKGFYEDKIKPFLVVYGSNCYDLIKYEKLLKSDQKSIFNIVVLNFFGKHKKIEDEIAKIKEKFNKSKKTPNTIYIILTTPNRILKLSNKNLLDYSFTSYNILDLTPNVKNLTFLDMKDCRLDFFKFIELFLLSSCINNTKFIININNDKKEL